MIDGKKRYHKICYKNDGSTRATESTMYTHVLEFFTFMKFRIFVASRTLTALYQELDITASDEKSNRLSINVYRERIKESVLKMYFSSTHLWPLNAALQCELFATIRIVDDISFVILEVICIAECMHHLNKVIMFGEFLQRVHQGDSLQDSIVRLKQIVCASRIAVFV